jgi:NADH:ubiquinone oxidoreductase subunit 6 (subunit J)
MQILVYAGAVTTMIVFSLMLAGNQDSPTGGVSLDNKKKLPALLVSGGLFLTVVFMIAGQKWPSVEKAAGLAAPSVAAIGRIIFSRYVLPFEVIGFLLLAALIGVIVVAGREE